MGKSGGGAPGNPSLGLKRNILFLEISQGFPVYFVGRISEGAMGGPRGSFRVRRSYTPLAARVWA
jgi:hypothetical protein